MSFVQFSGDSLGQLARVLQSEIDYLNGKIAEEVEVYERQKAAEKAAIRERVERQKGELFHILTLGIFIDDGEYRGSPCEFGWDFGDDDWYHKEWIRAKQKRVSKLKKLLSSVEAGIEHSTSVYVCSDDLHRMDYDYWTSVHETSS